MSRVPVEQTPVFMLSLKWPPLQSQIQFLWIISAGQ